jgi:hypothetical protein
MKVQKWPDGPRAIRRNRIANIETGCKSHDVIVKHAGSAAPVRFHSANTRKLAANSQQVASK